MAKRQHNHHIDVQTDEEIVTVTIGSDGGVPGGFAKLFNRVIDSEAWARLSDSARAVYIPMVRFADHRNQFRVRMGQAAIMKYSGLSRSSIKRAIKDLIQHKLVIVIERGGVSELGENESNTYQLLVPAEPRRQTGGSPDVNPQGVQQRTPSGTPAEPPPVPVVNRESARGRSPLGADWTGGRGATAGPQFRTEDKETNNTDPARLSCRDLDRGAVIDPTPSDAAVLLEKGGVDPAVARQLAATYPHERIVDVIATMEWRRARGKCDNPGGFIRDALIRQWQTPKPVLDARARAEARLRTEAAERQSRAAVKQEQASACEEEVRVDRLIASLDDDELQILAKSVLEKYDGNTAVTAVLTRKPARQCRLMKMEIAAMLSGGGIPR